MTIFEMLGQSGVLTVLGMGIVFSFLVILVLCVSAMGRIIHALGGDKDVAAVTAASAPSQTDAAQSAKLTAAITAAVNEYRKNNL